MDDFEHRLRTQKFVYLMQTFGIYLGYDFSWYLRGPYCSTLAASAFVLNDVYDDIPDANTRFENPATQKKFEKFQKFIKGHENENDFLEIAASIHYLKNTCTMNDTGILQKVVDKQPHFTSEQCEKIWKELIKWELL